MEVYTFTVRSYVEHKNCSSIVGMLLAFSLRRLGEPEVELFIFFIMDNESSMIYNLDNYVTG